MLANGCKSFATPANQGRVGRVNDAHGCRKRTRQGWTQELGVYQGSPLGDDAPGTYTSAEDNQILDFLDQPLADRLKCPKLTRGTATYADPCRGVTPRNKQEYEEVSIEQCMS